ncbi:EamA family transporter [Agromyces mediolanus]|uniref:Membrane protein n=1 Tax=Agromyces mediolanus TaxID=41986 RepID=A0A918CFF4_AGRME|nr:EamA family transporter [Agromyces mediolanus]GGR20333.1 membrane protein [Agromyces mediolanus]GLJ73206.1 membrane protein [Agromyces mediolanus]
MSPTALALVLAAACCHAAWNILAHGVSRIGIPFLWWGAVAATLVWLPLVPATGGLGEARPEDIALGVAVSALLHCGYMLVLQRGYARGRLSTVYATARGTGPTLTVIVAVTVLGERPSPAAFGGIAVILAGIVAIGLLDRGRGSAAASGAAASRTAVETSGPRRRLDPGIAWGLATGVAIAIYTVWDAHAVREWAVPPVAYMVGCTLGEIVLYAAMLGRRRSELLPVMRRHWPRILLFGALSPLSYILVLVAVTMAPVALVAPMREVSVVLVSLFGAIVLRESRPGWRLAASALVVGGIALLAM